MARYYNRTNAPIAASKVDGTPVSFPPKSWSEDLAADQEGSASIQAQVRKGTLFREPFPSAAEPVEEINLEPREPVTEPATPAKESPPWDGYDEQTVDEIRAKLGEDLQELGTEGLDRVEAYEASHKGRVTIGREVDDLREQLEGASSLVTGA